jgi:hypothetical protein
MSTLDTLASLAVGGYLVSVAVNGNGDKLIAQAKKNKGFVKWAIAVGIAVYAYKIPGMQEPVSLIIFMAFLGLFLENGTRIAQQATQFWNSLSDNLP